jgi:hypothetical protein
MLTVYTVKVCDACYPAASQGGNPFQTAAMLPATPAVEYGAEASAPPLYS